MRLRSSVPAVTLAAISIVEYLASATMPRALPALHVSVAVVACGSIALLPSSAFVAALVWAGAVTVELVDEPAPVFGTGVAMVAVAYGVGRWTDGRARAAATLAVAAASFARDSVNGSMTTVDALIDIAFVLFAVGAGQVVRSRSTRTAKLEEDLALADDRIADAVETERTRLARELHDIVAHAVSVMVVQAGTSRPLAERQSPELAEVLGNIEGVGREALVELRRLLGVLRGDGRPIAEPLPSVSDLAKLADTMRNAGLDVDLRVGQLPPLSKALATCVHRIVQEGLTNALRHAPGSRVVVDVATAGGSLAVSVVDDGARRPRARDEDHGSGVGLVGLRERVELFGGHLTTVRSAAGFELHAQLPLGELVPR